MDENKLKALTAELAKSLKTKADLNQFSRILMMLNVFAGVCDDKYPQISKSRRAHWENLNTFFSYLPDIRQAIYTTNAIESLNSVIRAEIRNARYSRETTQCGRLFIWRSKMSQKSGVCRSSTGGWQ